MTGRMTFLQMDFSFTHLQRYVVMKGEFIPVIGPSKYCRVYLKWLEDKSGFAVVNFSFCLYLMLCI